MKRKIPLETRTDFYLLKCIGEKSKNLELANKAWCIFYDRYKLFIWNSFKSVCRNLFDSKDIKDLVEIVFQKVYQKADSFKTGKYDDQTKQVNHVKSWLYVIADNEFKDWIEKEAKSNSRSVTNTEIQQIVDNQKDKLFSDNENESESDLSNEWKAFNKAWKSLNEREREVLRTSYWYYDPNKKHNKLPEDVNEKLCSFLGITEDNARVIRKRGIEKLEKRSLLNFRDMQHGVSDE